jgi:hypothetical protein
MGLRPSSESYTLEGSSGEHRPHVIGQLVSRMVENGAESADSCRAFKTSLIQYFVLSFLSDQLLEMVHNLVAPSHDGLNFWFIEKSLGPCC